MNYIYWLSQIQYLEQSLVGDKLFILSQLLQDRCPIFPGIDLAILVRPLISVYASGTVKIARDSISIEATWGLEASLLQGDVEPDRYELDRYTGDVRAQYLGLKNYAYRPRTDLATSSRECLEAYIPDEALASTYVLDSDAMPSAGAAIALLFELIQNVIEQQPQVKHIAWTAIKDTSQPQFYITRFSNYSNTTTITAEGQHNLNLILPFVRSVEEFKFCDRRIENAGLTTRSSFQVWIMAEVPATILLLPEYIRAGISGIAIGTNDLTQLLLGVDREQTQFSDRGLNANHPAVHKAIAELIKTANEGGIECSICGLAPVEYPNPIDLLIQWGITTISVEPDAVDRTYRAIARAERRMLLKSPSPLYKGGWGGSVIT